MASSSSSSGDKQISQAAPPGRAVDVLPPEILRELRQDRGLTDEQIEDMWAAVHDGVRTAGEYLGVTPAIANTIEKSALAFYRHGQYQLASTIYYYLLEMDPDRSTAWRGLAACMQAIKNYALAMVYYDNALESDPQDLVSKVYLGECLCLMGNPAAGSRVLTQALAFKERNKHDKLYLSRAKTLLQAQAGAAAAQAAQQAAAQQAPVPAVAEKKSPEQEPIANDPDLLDTPQVRALCASLERLVHLEQVTVKDVAGFTDEQMYGGYAAACRYLDMGQPLNTLQIVGWLLYLDARNASYYHLAGIAAQHIQLFCLADYLYGLALVYEPNNPISLIYRGEAKIFSEERHAGVALIRQGMALCGKDPEQQAAAQRGKALLSQFDNNTRKADKAASR